MDFGWEVRVALDEDRVLAGLKFLRGFDRCWLDDGLSWRILREWLELEEDLIEWYCEVVQAKPSNHVQCGRF